MQTDASVAPLDEQVYYPLSNAQSAIWFAHMLDSEGSGHNVGECLEICGAVDTQLFERALRQAVEETDAFHLRFTETTEGPRQFFLLDSNWQLPVIDLRDVTDPRAAAESWMTSDMSLGFDLRQGPLFRFVLFRLTDDRFFWYAANHHIINDSAGGSLFVRRVGELYSAFVEGADGKREERYPWIELLNEEHTYFESKVCKRDREYWREQLVDRPEAATLSGKTPGWPEGHVQSSGWISSAAVRDLNDLGSKYGASLPTILTVATAIYLHKLSGLRDLVLGTSVAARIGNRLRNTVGLVANVVPLRLSVNPSDRVRELVRDAARRMRDGLRHQRYHAGLLRQDIGLTAGDSNLYGTVVNFIPLEDDVCFADCSVTRRRLGNWRVEDLLVAIYAGADPRGVRLVLIANSANYEQEELDRHLQCLTHLMQSMADAADDTTIHKLEIIARRERDKILKEFNAARWSGSPKTLAVLLEEQSVRSPEKTAIIFGSASLRYAQLNARANRLARVLRSLGVGREDLVALALPRSVDSVVSLLAVHKAGAAYLPMDPSHPRARIEFMIADARPVLALTTSATSSALPDGTPRLVLDDLRTVELLQQQSEGNLDGSDRGGSASGRQAAYVMYTSGSTGAPKAVVVTHAGIPALAAAQAERFDVSSCSRVLQFASLTFDASVSEIVMALSTGATLVLAPDDALSGVALRALIAEQGITHATLPPAVLATIGSPEGVGLKCLVVAGEPCPNRLIEGWSIGRRMFNAYGPTETTVCASMSGPLGAGSAPIGSPILGTRLYVLNSELEPLPIGLVGELYVSGASLARGYLKRPGLTAERFIADPHAGVPGSRMYRTGDLARWRADGQLEFVGRADDQIKLRSFRIEPREIEVALGAEPSLAGVAVTTRTNQLGEAQLAAFVVPAPGQEPDIAALRERAGKHLPAYMIPDVFFILSALPVTRNGKVDRQALAAVGRRAAALDSPTHLPQTPTEEALCAIWGEILRVPRVSRLDDFFESGGNSLLATQVLSRVRDIFQVELILKSLFQARTLEAVARHIDAALRQQHGVLPAPSIEITRSEGSAPLSSSQERMWLMQALDPKNTAYNIVVSARLVGPLDRNGFAGAVNELFCRHDGLRSTFRLSAAEPIQDTIPWMPFEVQYVDLRDLREGVWAEALRQAEEIARTPFDLENGPISRVALFQTGDVENLFIMSLHHIAGDQWSLGILGRELADLYNGLCAGRPAKCEPLPISYRDYARWQRAWLDGPEFQRQLSYWRESLADLPPLDLPTDRARPAVHTLNGSFCQVSLPTELKLGLEQLGRRESSTLFMTTFAAFAVLLYRLTGQEDIPIAVPVANRTQRSIEGLVGTFVNTLILRTDLSGNPTFHEFLHRARTVALEAFSHPDVPFDKLVQEVMQPRDASRPPLVQVLFNLANTPMHGVKFDGLEWEPVFLNRGGAQFELSLSIDPETSHCVAIEYNTDIFDRRTIERLLNQYLLLLEKIIAKPLTRLTDLSLLPPDEVRALRGWNATSSDFPQDKIFIQLFEEQAKKCPMACAVSFENATLSYSDLNLRANIVASKLRALGVGPGTIVGVCVSRSMELLIALLAVQKSGGAYLPLDPQFPSARLEYMMTNSGSNVLIGTGIITRGMSPSGMTTVLDLAAINWLESGNIENVSGGAAPQDLAYIIYTSGSTGQPKGVCVPHIALTNFLWSMLREPGLTQKDVFAAVTTVCFDIAAMELYLPLLAGAQIELISREIASNGRRLSETLADKGVSVLQATPATWRMLVEAGWTGGAGFRAICGGESLSRELADALLDRADELWNAYGPTETTIWSTIERVSRGVEPVSIGRPIANTEVHIFDRVGGTQLIGVPGEIFIGGTGVALGYHANPELTRERFTSDAFSSQVGARLYRTGDLGYWAPDGKLFHLGRTDQQVKIRGFRIEPEEIESVLLRNASVRQSAVMSREARHGDQVLVAYIVYNEGQELTASEAREYLKCELPDYMIPSLFVTLDFLPISPNGKLDRRSLPSPIQAVHPSRIAKECPAPGLESFIAEIWQDILMIREVYAEDNFFELGGHSLLAIRVVQAIERRTRHRMDPRDLFFQNLRQIAAGIERKQPALG